MYVSRLWLCNLRSLSPFRWSSWRPKKTHAAPTPAVAGRPIGPSSSSPPRSTLSGCFARAQLLALATNAAGKTDQAADDLTHCGYVSIGHARRRAS